MICSPACFPTRLLEGITFYDSISQHLAQGLAQSRHVEDKSLSLDLPLCYLIQVVWLIQHSEA